MIVKQHDSDGKGFFFIQKGELTVAKMTYVWVEEDRIMIDHTEVDDSLKGQGAGKLLVAKAVDFARVKNIRIVPLCPFAKAVFKKVPEYGDVL